MPVNGGRSRIETQRGPGITPLQGHKGNTLAQVLSLAEGAKGSHQRFKVHTKLDKVGKNFSFAPWAKLAKLPSLQARRIVSTVADFTEAFWPSEQEF